MSKQHKPWFKPVRWSYLPISWEGALTYIPMLGALGLALWASYRQGGTWKHTVFIFFPYLVCITVVMHWFASHKT